MTPEPSPERIEEASLNAWPAPQQMVYDGWLLRFADGYTGRANSVNVIGPSTLDLDEKIDYCARQYAARGLPVKFRVTPLGDGFALDQKLHAREYDSVNHTRVQALALAGQRFPDGEPLECPDVDEWLRVYSRLARAGPELWPTQRAILRAIPGRVTLAVIRDDGLPVACGLGVQEEDYFGLFQIMTDPARRGQGYGTALVGAVLREAQQQGASWAYLQVAEVNAPALSLYRRFGFEQVYRYWYRVRPDSAAVAPAPAEQHTYSWLGRGNS